MRDAWRLGESARMTTSRSLFALALVSLVAGWVSGCAANTVCTIGAVACVDGAVRRCVGPAGGGDADGELIELVEDCAGRGLTCQLGVRDSGQNYGVCATSTCVTAHRSRLCGSVGAMACATDTIETCTMGTDGCLVWETSSMCPGMCVEAEDSASCIAF